MIKITLFHIANQNIRRKIFRSLAIAVSVAVVAGTLFSITTIMDSVETSLRRGTERLGADIMVVPANAEMKAKTALLAGDPSTFYMDKRIEDKVRQTEGVKKAASQLFLQSSEYECCDVADMLLIGFDPNNDFTIIPWLTKRLNRPLEDNEAIMGRALTAYAVGSNVRFYGTDIPIAGMLEETGMKFIDNSVFMPFKGLRKIAEDSATRGKETVDIPLDKVSTVLVQVNPEITAARVAIFIEHEIEGVKAIVSEQVIASVRKQLFILLRSILSISIVLWIMAMLLIGVVFSMIVNERQREIGLLRAMGAKKGNIFKLVMTEASVLSLAGGIIGISAGGLFLYIFKGFIRSSLDIPYLWPSAAQFSLLISFCLFLSFITGTLAALYPAIRSMRMEPYEAIRRGE
ncbi:MAG: FtsX-like permease family protein [Nitrospirota bacterium]|nr:MAG: FtsX-like permease family protein [Nitrospirota bacterium]